MKRTFPLCLAVLLGGFATASAQVAPAAPPHPHSLSLQVVPVSNGTTVQDAITSKQKTATFGGRERQYRSTTRTETTESSAAIEISVRNFGTAPDTAQVEWYFVAEPAHPDMAQPLASQRFIFDKGSKSVTLAPNGETKIPVTSQSVTAETVHHGKGRPRRDTSATAAKGDFKNKPAETGDKLGGWIVRVTADGKTVEAKGSRQEFEDAGKDDAKLAGLAAKD